MLAWTSAYTSRGITSSADTDTDDTDTDTDTDGDDSASTWRWGDGKVGWWGGGVLGWWGDNTSTDAPNDVLPTPLSTSA